MTKAQFLFWKRVQARASREIPDTSARILQAFQILRDSLSEGELASLIANPTGVDQLIDRALSDRTLDLAFSGVQQRLQETTQAGMAYFARDLPVSGLVTTSVAGAFNVLNPNVITAIQGLNTKVIQSLKDDVKAVVRASVQAGLEAGTGPRAIARGLRDVIGLGPSQLQQVENYRQALIDGKSVAGYTLRDQRLKPKTPEQIDKAVDAYRKRRIAQNAETNARTATLDSFKAGQRLSYQQAIDQGIIDAQQLQHQWIGINDDRERPSHVVMNNEVQPYDQPYSNGQMVPGEDEYNCRCLDRFFIAAA